MILVPQVDNGPRIIRRGFWSDPLRARIAKILIVSVLVQIMMFGLVPSAWAVGWWKENTNDTINEVANNGVTSADVAYWKNAVDNSGASSPHGSFSTTSNKCKTCHAVHGALSDSFRLLKNVDRAEECNYCHMGPAGASNKRLYALDDLGFSVRGEHTLGSTQVPDSDVNGGSEYGLLPDRGGPYSASNEQVLYCYACHSVHGAYTLQNDAAWATKILRQDPANNGGDANNGLLDYLRGSILTREDGETLDMAVMVADDPSYLQDFVEKDTMTTGAQVKAAFCGDCHNKNYNFRLNIAFAGDDFRLKNGVINVVGQDYTLNRQTHPMNDNQFLDAAGGAGAFGPTRVSKTNFTVEWCGVCHAGEKNYGPGGSDPWGTGYIIAGFPHQSKGNKLMDKGFGGDISEGPLSPRDATQTNDAYEALNNMDYICLQCHDSLVGITF